MVNVRVTVTWEFPDTVEVSRMVSGGVADETPTMISLERDIASVLARAPTLPRTTVALHWAWGTLLASTVGSAGAVPQLVRAAMRPAKSRQAPMAWASKEEALGKARAIDGKGLRRFCILASPRNRGGRVDP